MTGACLEDRDLRCRGLTCTRFQSRDCPGPRYAASFTSPPPQSDGPKKIPERIPQHRSRMNGREHQLTINRGGFCTGAWSRAQWPTRPRSRTPCYPQKSPTLSSPTQGQGDAQPLDMTKGSPRLIGNLPQSAKCNIGRICTKKAALFNLHIGLDGLHRFRSGSRWKCWGGEKTRNK